jgi:hypothetical protein
VQLIVRPGKQPAKITLLIQDTFRITAGSVIPPIPLQIFCENRDIYSESDPQKIQLYIQDPQSQEYPCILDSCVVYCHSRGPFYASRSPTLNADEPRYSVHCTEMLTKAGEYKYTIKYLDLNYKASFRVTPSKLGHVLSI